uniref:thioredoxin-dependent peroxiredoxin n=2 Tax=Clastoptera arizonana TaxID=38151 RepID=A0A1B6DRC5_9HEMI
MKFNITSHTREVVLPTNRSMNSSIVVDESGRSVAPKRTINEAGTIVLQSASEGGEPSSYILPDNGSGESVSYSEHNSSVDLDETPSKKKRVLPFRPKKFRSEWTTYDMFKNWLKPHSNPERAMCTVCDIVLNAGKSELEKHAAAKKHQRKMLECRQITNLSFTETNDGGSVLIDGQELDESIGAGSSFISHDSIDASAFNIDPNYSEQGTEGMRTFSTIGKLSSTESHTMMSKAVVTKVAPNWKATAIVNGHVTRLELLDYRGRYVVMFFYPHDFSALCPTEILALSDRISEFRALQTEVVACSVDSHLTHLAWARTPRSEGGLANPKIPLLADPTHSIAKDYGVLLHDVGHTLRAHFIIDCRGIIRHMGINDINVGRSIDELLRLVQALQHVDETESGCPADWKPGQPTV